MSNETMTIESVDAEQAAAYETGKTKYHDIWRALAAPFATVKQRAGGGGRKLSYITSRQAMNRFDAVLGPENWEDRYYEVHGVLFCEITITLPDGHKVTKADAGGFKTMMEGGKVDQENTDKTGPSDAFKRAAAKFGVARYLYNDGVVEYDDEGNAHEPGQGRAPAVRSQPPARSASPRPEPPARRPAPTPAPPAEEDDDHGQEPDYGDLPRSMKAIFPWVKSLEETYRGLAVLKPLNAWAKESGLPFKTTDWPETFGDGTPVLAAAIDFAIYQVNTFLGVGDPVTAGPR